jgi:hypothetical protein
LAEIDRVKTAFFSNVSYEFRTPRLEVVRPNRPIPNFPYHLDSLYAQPSLDGTA